MLPISCRFAVATGLTLQTYSANRPVHIAALVDTAEVLCRHLVPHRRCSAKGESRGLPNSANRHRRFHGACRRLRKPAAARAGADGAGSGTTARRGAALHRAAGAAAAPALHGQAPPPLCAPRAPPQGHASSCAPCCAPQPAVIVVDHAGTAAELRSGADGSAAGLTLGRRDRRNATSAADRLRSFSFRRSPVTRAGCPRPRGPCDPRRCRR